MSEREELQQRIVGWLNDRRDVYNAPYGVLASLEKLRRGAVRCITFGKARTLDATLYVWSPTNLYLKTSRGDFSFTSEAALYEHLSK